MADNKQDGATPRPWQTDGAKNVWSPAAKANIATMSDPYEGTTVGYHELKISSPHLHEACANADLIVAAVNAYNPQESAANKDRIMELIDEFADKQGWGYQISMRNGLARHIANGLKENQGEQNS
jgi:hypothetical protein